MTENLHRFCEMPNDKIVRQSYFTTLVNESFPNLKAVHDCELSKFSPEDIKEGAKDAQVGTRMMCMALLHDRRPSGECSFRRMRCCVRRV